MVQNEPRHKGLRVSAIIAVLMAITMLPAFAAKGSGGASGTKGKGHTGTTGGGTISLAPLVNDSNGDGLPNWGDTVTFDISQTATDQPWVKLECKQGGKMVAQGWGGYFDGSLGGRDFELDSPTWTGGAADCLAYLQTPQGSVLASTSFHVNA
jgi:hypothetical protein